MEDARSMARARTRSFRRLAVDRIRHDRGLRLLTAPAMVAIAVEPDQKHVNRWLARALRQDRMAPYQVLAGVAGTKVRSKLAVAENHQEATSGSARTVDDELLYASPAAVFTIAGG